MESLVQRQQVDGTCCEESPSPTQIPIPILNGRASGSKMRRIGNVNFVAGNNDDNFVGQIHHCLFYN